MKKLAFLFLTSLALLSCSSDDSSSGALKPASITVNGDVKTFAYDAKNRLTSVTEAGETATITYNSGNKVDKVAFPDVFYQFVYDGNTLASINTSDGGTLSVTSMGNNSYVIENTIFTRNAAGDWTNFSGYTYAYSSKKGPFANVKNLDLLAFYFADNESYYYASKKRFASVSYGATTYPFTSTEGEKGLPATGAVDAANIVYTYAE